LASLKETDSEKVDAMLKAHEKFSRLTGVKCVSLVAQSLASNEEQVGNKMWV